MRIALISDIHANLEALEAVVSDIEDRGADMVSCLGDVVGYGCDPIACIDLVEATCRIKLAGNHEYVALGRVSGEDFNEVASEAITWTKAQLGDREIALIEAYVMDASVEESLLVHASPREPDRWHYILSPDAAHDAFDAMKHDLCFFGHTHLPMIYSRSRGGQLRRQIGHSFLPDDEVMYLVNVGSVGQPRDNDPRASYVIYDSTEREITYRRVEYDVQRTQRKMAQARVPSILIDRLAIGR